MVFEALVFRSLDHQSLNHRNFWKRQIFLCFSKGRFQQCWPSSEKRAPSFPIWFAMMYILCIWCDLILMKYIHICTACTKKCMYTVQSLLMYTMQHSNDIHSKVENPACILSTERVWRRETHILISCQRTDFNWWASHCISGGVELLRTSSYAYRHQGGADNQWVGHEKNWSSDNQENIWKPVIV